MVSDATETVVLEAVRYDAANGLVPVVVQDVADGAVLMLAYANREALKRTLGTGQAWFWSRSRQAYWRKGETSGNVLAVRDVRLDCDGDTVLYVVDAAGPSCHTGSRSCFYRRIASGAGALPETVIAEDAAQAAEAERAETAAEAAPGVAVLMESLSSLWRVVSDRYAERPPGAYTTYLFEHGVDKIAKKVGEEAVEVVIAAKNAAVDRQELVNESADLLYHLWVLWRQARVNPGDVGKVLGARGLSAPSDN